MDSMIMFEVLIAMIFVVPVVAFMALMMWLLHRMNRTGRVWAGWMLLAVVFLLITAACFAIARYGVTTHFGLQSYQLWPEDKKITDASIDVAYDRTDKKAYGFSSLQIQYKDGNRYIPLEFDGRGTLIGSKEAMAYKREIQKALMESGPKVTLTGKSQSYTALKRIEKKYLDQKSTTLHKEVFFNNFMLYHMVTALLLVYFLVDLGRRKKKEKRNTDLIKIQDL